MEKQSFFGGKCGGGGGIDAWNLSNMLVLSLAYPGYFYQA